MMIVKLHSQRLLIQPGHGVQDMRVYLWENCA